MHGTQVLILFLALSGALDVALRTGIIGRLADVGMAEAVLIGGGAGTMLMAFFTVVAAYR